MSDTYKEKLKTVEARLFDGDASELMAVVTWIQENGYVWFEMFTPAPARGISIDVATGFLSLVDSTGLLTTAQKGDWIVKLPDGDMKRMKADEFAATFENV